MEGKTYFKNLDALRFYAAWTVFMYHIVMWLPFPTGTEILKYIRIIISFDNSGGAAGVNFFFVLSGFLITHLMFEESDSEKGFSLWRFYVRRALRIWPAYYFTLLLGFILPHLMKYKEVASPIMYGLFLANYDNIKTLPTSGILGVQWSVSVEEQFYLIWPLLFILRRNKKQFVIPILILFILSTIFLINGGSRFHLFSCIGMLSMGGLAAWFGFFFKDKVIRLLSLVPSKGAALIYFLGTVFIMSGFQLKKNFEWAEIPYLIVVSLFFVFIILEQCFSENSPFKAGHNKLFSTLGKRSYSIYLTHMIAITLALHLTTNFFFLVISAIVLTFIFSEISYQFVERPFLNLKDKLPNFYDRK